MSVWALNALARGGEETGPLDSLKYCQVGRWPPQRQPREQFEEQMSMQDTLNVVTDAHEHSQTRRSPK
ncbi:hypothetical protein EVAR_5106_1 [Eumeta japonica]|uniref:Uncharacterized protein n=1 Tax=Eumeta variegata TaxID=151549 RepID=A0A4C1SUE6_EUMVA|nr:hypothetical protein EVAR_5106_1 [Eumeta japonica]